MSGAKLVHCISCNHLISNQVKNCPKCGIDQIIKPYKCMVCKSEKREYLKKFHVCSVKNDARMKSILVCNKCFNLLETKQKEHYLFLKQKRINTQCNLCKKAKTIASNFIVKANHNHFYYSEPMKKVLSNSSSLIYIGEPKQNSDDPRENQKLDKWENFANCENCGNTTWESVIDRLTKEFHYEKLPCQFISDHGKRSSSSNHHRCWVCGMGFSTSKSKPIFGLVYFEKDKNSRPALDLKTSAFFHQDCLDIIDPNWKQKIEKNQIKKKLEKIELEKETKKMESILNSRETSEAIAKAVKKIMPWAISLIFSFLSWSEYGFGGLIGSFIIGFPLGLWIGHIFYEKHEDMSLNAFIDEKVDGHYIGSVGIQDRKKKLERLGSEINEIDSENFPYIGEIDISLE